MWVFHEGCDFLQLAVSFSVRRDQEAEDNLRRELSRHLRYCLQSTPMNVTQLQPLWFLLSSDRVGAPALLYLSLCRC